MAAFRLDPDRPHLVHPDDAHRLDRLMLVNGPVTLYYSPTVLREDVAALELYGYFCPAFQCADWNTEMDMHEAFGAQLDFPEYYGQNLDALNDSLHYIEIAEESGTALVLWNFDDFWRRYPYAWDVLDIIANNAWGHLLYGRRLLALVQSSDLTFSPDAVGARPVMWNRREFLNRSRGVA